MILPGLFAATPERDTTIVTVKGDTLRGAAMEPMLSSFDRSVYVTYGDVAHSSAVVHWGSPDDQPSVVAYGTTTALADRVRSGDWSCNFSGKLCEY